MDHIMGNRIIMTYMYVCVAGTTAHHVGSDTVASRQRQVPKKREMKERTLKYVNVL